jgi:hypothetical protein
MQNNHESSFAEKRRFKRHPLNTQVGILDRGAFSFETSVEISEGGMQLQVFKPLIVGQRVEVRFFLPNGPFVAATGEVVYIYEPNTRQYHAGIRFLNIPEEVAEAIRAYGSLQQPR